ncbi:MAG: hypothetical protein ABSD59_19040 [Terracidiphilus sp.]|jgi:hypothetical protein
MFTAKRSNGGSLSKLWQPGNAAAFTLLLTGLLVLLGCVWGDPILRANQKGGLVLIGLAILAGITGIALIGHQDLQPRLFRWESKSLCLAGLLIVVHCVSAYERIHSDPGNIDTFIIERDATRDLLRGSDPYGATRPNYYNAQQTKMLYGEGLVVNGRLQVGLQYPPVTFLCTVPGLLLFHDIRYGFVAAIVLAAIMVMAVLPGRSGLVPAAFFLLNPITYIVEVLAWTEPLVWMLLCLTVMTALKKPRWLALALGLFLASKQYNFLALPFIACLLQPFSWRAFWRLLGKSIAVAVLTVLPFAIWNVRALWRDLIAFHLAQPFRYDSVSFAILSPVFLKIGPILVLAFIAWILWRGNFGPRAFPALYGMAMLLFVSTNKQAFLNYYFLISNAFLLAGFALKKWNLTPPPPSPPSIKLEPDHDDSHSV